MSVRNLEVEDYGNLLNALQDGPSQDAVVSFDVRWDGRISQPAHTRNGAPDEMFVGLFTRTDAKVVWSAAKAGFTFQSDPAETSRVVYAEVGEERNGVFF